MQKTWRRGGERLKVFEGKEYKICLRKVFKTFLDVVKVRSQY